MIPTPRSKAVVVARRAADLESRTVEVNRQAMPMVLSARRMWSEPDPPRRGFEDADVQCDLLVDTLDQGSFFPNRSTLSSWRHRSSSGFQRPPTRPSSSGRSMRTTTHESSGSDRGTTAGQWVLPGRTWDHSSSKGSISSMRVAASSQRSRTAAGPGSIGPSGRRRRRFRGCVLLPPQAHCRTTPCRSHLRRRARRNSSSVAQSLRLGSVLFLASDLQAHGA